MTDEYTCCGITFLTVRELGGHAKTHSRPRLDTPDCFTDEAEWKSSIARLRQENPGKMITPDFALAEACAVCPLEFMLEMGSKARCHPPKKAWPQRDLREEALA